MPCQLGLPAGTSIPWSWYSDHAAIPGQIPSQNVQQYRLRDVVSIVSSYNLLRCFQGGPSVESLPPEDSAERAVVFGAHLPHNLIHGPAIQLLVRDHCEGDLVLQSKEGRTPSGVHIREA